MHEYRTKGPAYWRTVQTTLKASCTGHYRKGLIDLLDVLEFRSTSTARQPVIEALRLIARYARAGNVTCYPAGEAAPAHRGPQARGLTWCTGRANTGRRGWSAWSTRPPPSRRCATSCAARRSGSAAPGGGDPDEDLPKDFEARRAGHYASPRKPLDPAEFSGALREEMTVALAVLNDALPDLDWVRHRRPPGRRDPADAAEAAPEPGNLRRIKKEVVRRWAAVPLIDVLKETVLRLGCLQAGRRARGGASATASRGTGG